MSLSPLICRRVVFADTTVIVIIVVVGDVVVSKADVFLSLFSGFVGFICSTVVSNVEAIFNIKCHLMIEDVAIIEVDLNIKAAVAASPALVQGLNKNRSAHFISKTKAMAS